MVVFVEAFPFERNTHSAKNFFYVSVTLINGTIGQWIISKGLFFFKLVAANLATVLISRHTESRTK